MELENSEIIEWLDKTCLVDLQIGDHQEQVLCHMTKLNIYTVVLGDGWLQTHNPVIDWRDHIMRFNSAFYIEERCLSRGILCTKFTIDSKANC